VTLAQLDLLAALKPDPPAKPKKAAPRKKRRAKREVSPEARVEYLTDEDEEGRRRWVLRFPAPDVMLSVNGNPHWRRTAPIRKTYREAMFVHLKAAKLPTGLAKVRIGIVLRFPTAAKHDGGETFGRCVRTGDQHSSGREADRGTRLRADPRRHRRVP
jgi:hypothetical protein